LPHGGVPDDLDVEDLKQFGLQAGWQGGQVGGYFWQQADQVGGGGRGGVGGQVVELGLDVLAFGVQAGVVGADAAPVGLAGLVGHVEGFVEFAHQAVLPGGQPLEPFGQGGGLPVVLGVPGGGGVRDELGQPLFPPGGQRISGQAAERLSQQDIFADLHGAGVIGGGRHMAGSARVVLAHVIGVFGRGLVRGVDLGQPAHAPLADFAADPGPERVAAPVGRVVDRAVAGEFQGGGAAQHRHRHRLGRGG